MTDSISLLICEVDYDDGCEEAHLNLTYRWFCRLDLSDGVPDYLTFSKNRHGRFRDSDLLRHLFETVVARCIVEGLVNGQRFAVDTSLIEADTNRQNSKSKEEWEPDKIDPEDAPRAVREYLETLDAAAFGAAILVQPKFTSHSDPVPQSTAARKGSAYSANYMIDTDNAVILDVKASRSVRKAEVGAARTMIDYATSCKLRKKVEMLFAHLKRILKLDRLRLRRP